MQQRLQRFLSESVLTAARLKRIYSRSLEALHRMRLLQVHWGILTLWKSLDLMTSFFPLKQVTFLQQSKLAGCFLRKQMCLSISALPSRERFARDQSDQRWESGLCLLRVSGIQSAYRLPVIRYVKYTWQKRFSNHLILKKAR